MAIGGEIMHFVTAGDVPLPAVEVTETSALRMDRPRVTIGRSSENDITLDHPTVSPVHAEIVVGGSVTEVVNSSLQVYPGWPGIFPTGRSTRPSVKGGRR